MAVIIREQIISASDPGAVGMQKLWIDVSVSPALLRVRNDTNDGWLDILLSSVSEAVLFTAAIDLTAIADTDIAIPTGYHFYIDEMGIVCDTLDTMTVQPTISFGITGNTTKHLAAAITTQLTATFKRENYMPLVPDDGETDLNISVTIGATATAMTGRAYWTGVLVKDP